MEKRKLTLHNTLRCPFAVTMLIGLASAVSLAAAYTAEFALGLEPCILCLYQRIPFAIVITLSLFGLIFAKIKKGSGKKILPWIIGLSGLAFLVNSAIALYHTGVEQKWWVSAVEGCTVPNFGDAQESMLDKILKTPTVACDQIAWVDPVLGLSMANYNVVFCLALFGLCVLSLVLSKKT